MKKIVDFIIEKRYLIALICLALFTVFGITGSSMGAITNWILEPEKANNLIGTYKFIRSDEYGVDTLFTVGQLNNGFARISNLIANGKTDMFFTIYVPIKSLLMLFRIYNIGYLIPGLYIGFSFSGSFKLIASLLITFEFFQIVTNRKKYLSFVGTILVIGSSFIAWWFREAIEIIAFGELTLIALDKFMNSKEPKWKAIWSAVFVYSLISYIMTLYPAWIISFGYVFLALAIWIIIKNFKNYKENNFNKKIDIICLACILICIVTILGVFYVTSREAITAIMNTSYPGARQETGGHGIKYLFSYLYSFMLPFRQDFDTMEFASFMSFFPVPLIIGLIYLYKKEKHGEFILPMLIVMVLEIVWCLSGIPGVFGKITLLSQVPVERCSVAIGLASIYLYIYMFANIDERVLKQTHSGYIVLAILVALFFIEVPTVLNTKGNLYIFVMIEALGGFLLLNIGDKNYQKLFLGFAVIISLISSVFVNPISIGIKPITETDFAKFVQKEVQKNPESVWIVENTDMVVSNYLVAQGAKTVSATQTYPSKEFWSKVLDKNVEKDKDIWNRYSHIRVKFIENEKDSYVELASNDHINLYITPNKLKELNVKYIVSYKDLEEIWKDGMSIKKIYSKKTEESTMIDGEEVYGIYIYEFVN